MSVDGPVMPAASRDVGGSARAGRTPDKRTTSTQAAIRARGAGGCQQGPYGLTMRSPIRTPTTRATGGRPTAALTRAGTP